MYLNSRVLTVFWDVALKYTDVSSERTVSLFSKHARSAFCLLLAGDSVYEGSEFL
jgi:hypothetical protein